MNVLIVTWNFPPRIGGMERLNYQIVQHLSRHINVTVCAPGTVSAVDTSTSARIVRLGERSVAGYYFATIVYAIKSLRDKDVRFDAVLGFSALVLPLIWLISVLHRVPMVLQVYGLDVIYNNRIYQLFLKILLPRCNLVVAISNETRQLVLQKGVPSKNIVLSPPGIEIDEFESYTEPCLQNFGLSADKLEASKVMLFVGRLAPRKGVAEFVEHCMPHIVESIPNALFIVVGGNADDSLTHKGNYLAALTSIVEQKGLKDHVLLAGQVDRTTLIALFGKCDLFVFPAIEVEGDVEGFGIVLLEASAAGKPVLATRVGGIPSAVEDTKSGILVAPNEWARFSREAIHLLGNDSLAKELGSYGRKRVVSNFGWPYIIGNYLQRIRSVIET